MEYKLLRGDTMKIEDIYGNFPTFETERLILRKISLDDLEDIFAYGSNDKVSKYVTWDTHRTLSDTKQFIEFVLNKYAEKQVSPWAIEYKDNGRMIGTIDFVLWNPAHQTAEIGYVLHQDYWGKGITAEAAKELIKFGFDKMDLIRIQARCFSENTGSKRVMEKIGMSYEGTLRKAVFIKEKHWDLKVFSILKEEFEERYLLKQKKVYDR